MNSAASPSYDLWPLPWWHHPFYIAGVGALLLTLGIVLFLLRRRKKRQLQRPRSLRDRLLLRLHTLREKADDHGPVPCYIELMSIMREFVATSFCIPQQGLTDEEFTLLLSSHENPHIPTDLLLFTEKLCDESCQIKFAAGSISHEVMMTRLNEVIKIIEAHRAL